eukprot:c13346_g1_i1 orf=315-467(-)
MENRLIGTHAPTLKLQFDNTICRNNPMTSLEGTTSSNSTKENTDWVWRRS